MCGIAGVGGPLDRDEIRMALSKMGVAIAHRGPDDAGEWAIDGFGFCMRRLSVIDIAGGHQPMWDEGSDNGIVYNGEIYNYLAIKRDLERGGVHFSTTSDTEVVLRSFAKDGIGAVKGWNGMFSLAQWAKSSQQLTLVRDRIGVKPLYYYWDGRIFLFASEIKAILASGLVSRRINKQALWDYLTFRYVPSPETMWENIWKLPPGHYLRWSPGSQPVLEKYWDTDVISSPEPFSYEQKLEEFEELFLDSVQMRLLASDVPVGVLLSGGLDSSAVAAAAVELGHKKFHTFSVGFEDGGNYSELPYARMMADHVGAQYHDILINRSSFLEMLPDVVRSTDEPLADLSAVPLYAVSRLARENVKVVLSGEGSDEVLAGYNLDSVYRYWKLAGFLQSLPSSLLKTVVGPAKLLPGKMGSFARRVAGVPVSEWNVFFNIHMTRHWTQGEKMSLWPGYKGSDSDQMISAFYSLAKSNSPLDQLLSVYQRSWLVEDLLMKADKMSMATSLELRVPFLDYRLVEWANRQPTGVKIKRKTPWLYSTKAILRSFAEKRLPPKLIRRRKLGFPVPAYSWLKDGKFTKWVEALFFGENGKLAEFFSHEVMNDILQSAAKGSLRDAHKAWLLIVLEIWFRENGASIDES